MTLRSYLLCSTVIMLAGSARAQAPAPIPPVPDAARVATYNITSSTPQVQVPFAVFGDCSDIEVKMAGDVISLPTSLWNCASASGTGLSFLPLPITDMVVNFTPALTSGTVIISGKWHPRRTVQPTAPGINRREFNQAVSTAVAGQREIFTRLDDLSAAAVVIDGLIPGNATISGNATIGGNATIMGSLSAAGGFTTIPGSVPDWTGTPGNGTDNAPAFQSAFTATCALIVPPGRFRLASGLSSTCPTVSITGPGAGISELVFDGIFSAGITLDGSGTDSDRAQVTIEGVSIKTTQAPGGTAVVIKQYPNLNNHRGSRKASISNVIISGDNSQLTGWATGLKFYDSQQVQIDKVALIGQGGRAYPNNTQAQETLSTYAIDIVDTVGTVPDVYNISNTHVYYWQKGINAKDDVTGVQSLQGLHLSNTELVHTRYGIDWKANPVGQGLTLSNTHINAYMSAIKAYIVRDIVLTNNVFFIDPGSTETAPILIDITSAGQCSGSGNSFIGYKSTAGGTPGTAIQLITSNHCDFALPNSILSYNSGLAYGIHTLSGTENYINAHFAGIFTVDALKDDVALSTSTNVMGQRGRSVYKTAAQAIPTTTATAAVYATTEFDTNAFASAGGGTIPANDGVRRARVCAGGTWASNATGYRFIEIRKNGTGFYSGKPQLRSPALTGGTQEQTICSGYLAVADGDVFQVIYQQTSGADLDITNTWFTLDALN